jgi:phage terminase small subunit
MRVLRRPGVRGVIREIEEMVPSVIEEAAAVAGITKARVMLELSRIGFANMEDFTKLDEQGHRLLDFTDVTREQMAAVKSLTVETHMEGRGENAREVKRVKLELHDKRNALRAIGAELGMFKERRQLDVTVKDETARRKGEEARQAMIEHLKQFEQQKLIEAMAETVEVREPAKPKRQCAILSRA